VAVTVWVIVGASLAVAALAAIGYFALGVFRAVKSLSKEVGRAGRSLADAMAPIQAGLAQTQNGRAAQSRSSSADR